jgi:transcriptional regulator with XRE-family HTH domain
VPTTDNSADLNKLIGWNLQRLRKDAELSQSDLAERLTERGVPFRQQTVLKIEKGARPLRVDEAAIIAEILDLSVDELLRPHDERTLALREVVRAQREVEVTKAQLQQIDDARQAVVESQQRAEQRLRDAHRRMWELEGNV